MAYINKTNAAALSFLKEARRVNLLLNAADRLHLLPHCSSNLGGKQCMRIPCCCMQQRGPIGAPFACKYNGNVFSASFAANRRRSLSVEQMFKGLYCMRFFSDGPRRGASLNKSIIKEKNYYVLLGVKENEKTAGIRAAYLRLAKTLHPDVNVRCTDKKNKEKQFKEVKEAYEVLINPQQRKEYDERIRNSINRKQQTAAAAAAEAADQQMYRHCRNVWHEGRNEFGEEFWNQVNQIKREKDRARNTMKGQREGWGAGVGDGETNKNPFTWGPAFALLRAMPLLLLPILVFAAVYRLSRAKNRQKDFPLTPIYRDELGRAFFVDSQGRHYRVVEFDLLHPTGPS